MRDPGRRDPLEAEPRQAEQHVDEIAATLRTELAMEAAGIGTFDWDLVSGVIERDERLAAVFVDDPTPAGPGLGAFTRRVHPDDREDVTLAVQRAIDARDGFDVVYRVVVPGGATRWISARGRVLSDAGGAATRLLGAASDVTDQLGVVRVLESMPAGFYALTREWRFTQVNAEAERMLDRHRDELIGEVLWEAFPAAVGSEFEEAYRRAVTTGEPVTFDAYYPAPLDGWYEVRAWPTADGLSVYFLEVTERVRAQDELRRAAERVATVALVSTELAGSLDAEVATGQVPRLVVPVLADACIVRFLDEHGHAQAVSTWHADEDRRDLLERYARSRLPSLTSIPAVTRTMSTGDVLQLSGEQALATTLRDVADRLGMALDNARLYGTQRRLALELQRSMLTAPSEPDHAEVVVRYLPAAEAAAVGGDWYDAFLTSDDATTLVIGDVAGHDTAAAATMGQLRSLLRGIAIGTGAGPADVLRDRDRSMGLLRLPTLVTAAVARLEQVPAEVGAGTTRLRWSNAGRPGRESVAVLDRGTTVLLYTDGLVERRDSDLDQGQVRLTQALTELADRRLPELCDLLVQHMVDGRPDDDAALVAVRIRP